LGLLGMLLQRLVQLQRHPFPVALVSQLQRLLEERLHVRHAIRHPVPGERTKDNGGGRPRLTGPGASTPGPPAPRASTAPGGDARGGRVPPAPAAAPRLPRCSPEWLHATSCGTPRRRTV